MQWFDRSDEPTAQGFAHRSGLRPLLRRKNESSGFYPYQLTVQWQNTVGMALTMEVWF